MGTGLHLAEVAARVTHGRPCALLVDQAGWPMSAHLAVPANITIVPPPAKCPALNPVENVGDEFRSVSVGMSLAVMATMIAISVC